MKGIERKKENQNGNKRKIRKLQIDSKNYQKVDGNERERERVNERE